MDKKRITQSLHELMRPNNLISKIRKQINDSDEPSLQVGKLSSLSTRSGLIDGDLIVSRAEDVTSVDPTDSGFTGVFMSGGAQTFGTTDYNFGGVSAGTLMAGMRTSDGALVAGAETIKIDADGIEVVADNSGINDISAYKFVDSTGGTVLSGLYGVRTGAANYLEALASNGSIDNFFIVQSSNTNNSADGYVQIEAASGTSIIRLTLHETNSGNGVFYIEQDADTLFQISTVTGAVTVNQDNIDLDFIVKDDAGNAALTVDAGAGFVSVGDIFNIANAGTLTLGAGGAVTITGSLHSLDTYGTAATDNLITVNGGVNDGDIVIFTAESGSRVVTLKDNTDNLRLAGDFALDALADKIALVYYNSYWHELFRSDNA